MHALFQFCYQQVLVAIGLKEVQPITEEARKRKKDNESILILQHDI